MKDIISLIKEPFSISESVFGINEKTFTDATLYVPIGTKEKYQVTDGWKLFKNIEEFDPGEDPSEIDGILTSGKSFDVYTITGIKIRTNVMTLEDLSRGIYIVEGKKIIIR